MISDANKVVLRERFYEKAVKLILPIPGLIEFEHPTFLIAGLLHTFFIFLVFSQNRFHLYVHIPGLTEFEHLTFLIACLLHTCL